MDVRESRWKAPPCLTIRGLTREEHRRLSVLAATAGVRSREDYVRRLIRCALPDGEPAQDLQSAGVVPRDQLVH